MSMPNSIKTDSLSLLGIHQWQLKTNRQQDCSQPESDIAPIETPIETTATCQPQQQTASQAVFGAGKQEANVMFIGEASGTYEEQQGRPFVGDAGELLTKMLAAIQLTREEVYLSNILKCQPADHSDSPGSAMDVFATQLNQHINLAQPKIIVALGSLASHYLLKKTDSLEILRTQSHRYGEKNIPLITTYHPAHLMKNPADKRKAYQDLLLLQKMLSELK